MYTNYRNTSIASFSSADSSNYDPTMSTQSLNLTPADTSPANHHDFWSGGGGALNGALNGDLSEITLPAQSHNGIVTVFQFTPTQGEPSARITVNIGFRQLPGRVIGLRVVFGGIGLRTLVAHGHKRGHWQLRAEIPDMTSHGSPSEHKLQIEALEGDGVIDSVDFGTFTFYESGRMPLDVSNQSILSRRVRSFEVQQPPHMHRSSTTPFRPSSLSATLSAAAAASAPALVAQTASSSPPSQAAQVRSLAGNPDAYRIVRRTEIPMEREATALAVVLNIHGDVRAMSSGWSPEELACRRRLVQFWRHTEGNVVNVHFCSIRPEEYDDSRVVVSCIYRDDVDKCYITSFDLIRLLEGIIGTVCNIDEKNRIRRNVHHIEHDTISKSKPYHEEFFDLLMSFPAPMPRRNVRDLKAFRWEYLPEALHAIIDKMALDYNPQAVSEMIEPSIPEVPEPAEDSFPSYATSLRSEPTRDLYSGHHDRRESSFSIDSSFEFRKPASLHPTLSYDHISPNASVASFHSHHSHQSPILGQFNGNNPYGSRNPSISQLQMDPSQNLSVSSFHNHNQQQQQQPQYTMHQASPDGGSIHQSMHQMSGSSPNMIHSANGSPIVMHNHSSESQSPTDMMHATPSPGMINMDAPMDLSIGGGGNYHTGAMGHNNMQVDSSIPTFNTHPRDNDGYADTDYYGAPPPSRHQQLQRMASQTSLEGALSNFYPY